MAIVTPVFNDWACLWRLVAAIGEVSPHIGEISVFAVDDGSTRAVPPTESIAVAGIARLDIIHLVCNLGHQRAIAVGLCKVAECGAFDAVVVMDSDGEDKPEDLVRLFQAQQANPQAVVVAQRARRSEPLRFRLFYSAYKLVFRICTGQVIDFGNYCLIPACQLDRLMHMAETWNHLAAALLKSRIPVVRVGTSRGLRYTGGSTMNLNSLLLHGFSAISVFVDTVFVRLAMLCAALAGLATLLGVGAAVIRFATDAAIPGWATSVAGFALLVFFQALTLLLISVLVMQANRSSLTVVPATHARTMVRGQHTSWAA